MREEVAEVGTCGPACDLAAPDPGGRDGAEDGGDGAVVELIELFLCAVPIYTILLEVTSLEYQCMKSNADSQAMFGSFHTSQYHEFTSSRP